MITDVFGIVLISYGQLGMTDNSTKDIVEVVGNAAGQGADGFQLLSLLQLLAMGDIPEKCQNGDTLAIGYFRRGDVEIDCPAVPGYAFGLIPGGDGPVLFPEVVIPGNPFLVLRMENHTDMFTDQFFPIVIRQDLKQFLINKNVVARLQDGDTVIGIFNDGPVARLAFPQGLLDLLSFVDFLEQFTIDGGQGLGPLADVLLQAVCEVLQPQKDGNPRQELILVKGFGDIVHGAQRKTMDFFLGFVQGGHEHHHDLSGFFICF